jgi:hypothetical protein
LLNPNLTPAEAWARCVAAAQQIEQQFDPWSATITVSGVLPHEGMLPDGLLSFRFLSSFLSWFAGREAPGPRRLQLFCNSRFSRRFGAMAQAAQNHFSHTLGAPCLDPAMQRS